MLNTKDDYIQLKDSNVEGWEKEWLYLLESRFKVNEIGELVEDLDNLIELGFTVEEIEKAINFTGLTNTELTYRKNNPDIWSYNEDEDKWTYNENWKQERIEKAIEHEKKVLAKELAEAKERRLRAGICIYNMRFSTDEVACQKYNELGMIFMSFPTYEIENWKVKDWTTGETKYVTMDVELWAKIQTEKMKLEERLFGIQKLMLEEINNMTTVQEVSTFDPDGSFWDNTLNETIGLDTDNFQNIQNNYNEILRYVTQKNKEQKEALEKMLHYEEMEKLRLKAEGMDEEMRKRDEELTAREEELKAYYEEYRKYKEELENPTPPEPYDDGEIVQYETKQTEPEETEVKENNNVI